MAGGSGPRNVNSRYQRAREDADARENALDGRRQRARSSGSGSGSGRGRPPLVNPRDVPEEERRTIDSSEDEQVWVTDDEGGAQEGGEAGSSSTASAADRPNLRGPSKLLGPPLHPLRPVIRPQGDR
jgi:hypothetical protein